MEANYVRKRECERSVRRQTSKEIIDTGIEMKWKESSCVCVNKRERQIYQQTERGWETEREQEREGEIRREGRRVDGRLVRKGGQ